MNMTAKEAAYRICELTLFLYLDFPSKFQNIDFPSKPENNVMILAEANLEALKMGVRALHSTEPRVLTLEEARSIDQTTPVWSEAKCINGKLEDVCELWRCVPEDDWPQYGTSIRIWAGAKPTHEQMTATPWRDAD
jgi:hypothetical protein